MQKIEHKAWCYQCGEISEFSESALKKNGCHRCKKCRKEETKPLGIQLSRNESNHPDKTESYRKFAIKHYKLNHLKIKSVALPLSESDEQILKTGEHIDSMGTIDSRLCDFYNIRLDRFFCDSKHRNKGRLENHFNGNFKDYMHKFGKYDSIISDSMGIPQWCNIDIIKYFLNHLNKNGNLVFLWRNYFANRRKTNIEKYFLNNWNMKQKPSNIEEFTKKLKKVLNVKRISIIYESRSKRGNPTILFNIIKKFES